MPGDNPKGTKTPVNPDPAFYRMLTTYLKEANKHVGRIQALGATVYVAKPGDNITQCLFIAEDGVNTLVKDKEDVEIPDLEIFIIRLEEMCKVSAEQAVDLASKASQVGGPPHLHTGARGN